MCLTLEHELLSIAQKRPIPSWKKLLVGKYLHNSIYLSVEAVCKESPLRRARKKGKLQPGLGEPGVLSVARTCYTLSFLALEIRMLGKCSMKMISFLGTFAFSIRKRVFKSS